MAIEVFNEYGQAFNKLYQAYKDKDYKYFEEQDEEITKKQLLKFTCPKEMYDNCVDLAKEKAKYTCSKDQQGRERPINIKEVRQFKGVVAEMATQLYLTEICRMPYYDVHRWDLQRKRFERGTFEYDVFCRIKNYSVKFESRSSNSYCTSLGEFLQEYDVIGPYVSPIKKNEDTDDFYIRPVFQYKTALTKSELETENNVEDICQKIVDSEITLYIVGGASKDEMFGPLSYEKSMSQGTTKYHCIHIKDIGDAEIFGNKIEHQKSIILGYGHEFQDKMICPVCAAPMEKRQNSHDGSYFFGCTNYNPNDGCKYTTGVRE